MKHRKSLAMGLAVAILVFCSYTLLPAADGSEKRLSSGGWTATDNMQHPRQNHTATLLDNGKVLIVGWDSNAGELYDPATDTFVPTGSTNHNHSQGFSATLLNDGTVLLAGGTNGPRIAEIYVPETGTRRPFFKTAKF